MERGGRRDVSAQQRRLRHWIVARRKISVLRINVSHKTNFWFTLEGIGEVVKEKKKKKWQIRRSQTPRRGERKFPGFPRPRFRIHDVESISWYIYIYVCTCNRYYGEDSVHLLPLTINFSRTRFLPPFFFMVEGARFTMHSSRCIPV